MNAALNDIKVLPKMRIALLVLLIALTSCSSEEHIEWTDYDKNNIKHFFASREANQQYVQLTNSGNSIKTSASPEQFLIRLKKALHEAKQLDNAVLAKAHPELPEKYRSLYQASLMHMIRAFENRDNRTSIKGTELHDQWVDWYNSNLKKIRIPE